MNWICRELYVGHGFENVLQFFASVFVSFCSSCPSAVEAAVMVHFVIHLLLPELFYIDVKKHLVIFKYVSKVTWELSVFVPNASWTTTAHMSAGQVISVSTGRAFTRARATAATALQA